MFRKFNHIIYADYLISRGDHLPGLAEIRPDVRVGEQYEELFGDSAWVRRFAAIASYVAERIDPDKLELFGAEELEKISKELPQDGHEREHGIGVPLGGLSPGQLTALRGYTPLHGRDDAQC